MELSGQLYAPAFLRPLKDPLDGPQSRSGRGGDEKNNPFIAPVGY